MFATARRAAACGAALCITACAATGGHVPSLLEQPRPLASAADERELWKIAAEVESRVLQGRKLHADPALEAYVQSIAERLLRAAHAPPSVRVRAHVTSNRAPDAFVLVNGALYISAGLIVALENEAQLAALIGHELTHYLRRDTLRVERAQARGAALARALESEADRGGLELMAAAGYRPDQALAAYARLLTAVGSRAAARRISQSSHPRLAERVAAIEAQVLARYGAQDRSRGFEGRESFAAHARPLAAALSSGPAPGAGSVVSAAEGSAQTAGGDSAAAGMAGARETTCSPSGTGCGRPHPAPAP